MCATRACTPLSRRPSYSSTELMAFAELELPYIPSHFPGLLKHRRTFLQSRTDSAESRFAEIIPACQDCDPNPLPDHTRFAFALPAARAAIRCNTYDSSPTSLSAGAFVPRRRASIAPAAATLSCV